MSNTQRPTPECDTNAFVARKLVGSEYHGLHDVIHLKIGEKFERERDEASELVKACMAAMPVGNIQTHTPENLASRIGDLAHALASETNENEAMREAIKVAHTIIERYSESAISHSAQLMCPECLRIEAFDEEHKDSCSIGNALAKLQPFLKP